MDQKYFDEIERHREALDAHVLHYVSSPRLREHLKLYALSDMPPEPTEPTPPQPKKASRYDLRVLFASPAPAYDEQLSHDEWRVHYATGADQQESRVILGQLHTDKWRTDLSRMWPAANRFPTETTPQIL